MTRKPLNDKEKIHIMLKGAGPKGVSSKRFYEEFLGRGAARIKDLRNEGVEIDSTERDPEDRKYCVYKLVGVGAEPEKVNDAFDSGEKAPGPRAHPSQRTASVDSSEQLFELEKPKPKPNYLDVWDDGKAA